MGTGSFPGIKRPGRDVDHPPPSSVEVKERVELYLYSLCACMISYRVTFTHTYIIYYTLISNRCKYRLSNVYGPANHSLRVTAAQQSRATQFDCVGSVKTVALFVCYRAAVSGNKRQWEVRLSLNCRWQDGETAALLWSFWSTAVVSTELLVHCFSNFVRPRPGKFFFHKTMARS